MNRVRQDIVRFFGGHWPHLLLAIPGAVAFTAAHELAHCAAAWLQGATVTEFVWLPSGSEWGHMRYTFPEGVNGCHEVVSLAPYACWSALCFLAGVLSLKPKPWPFWIASSIFVWFFIAPLADIANTAVPYVALNAANDLQNALGPIRAALAAGIVLFSALAALAGFFIQKRLYRERSLGLFAYCMLATVGALGIMCVTLLRYP